MKERISESQYRKLKLQPLFFMQLTEEKSGNNNVLCWKTVDKDIDLKIPFKHRFQGTVSDYCLFILEDKVNYICNEQGEKTGEVYVYLHDATTSIQDYKSVIGCCFERRRNTEDKYYFIELLWLLNKYDINVSNLANAIQNYDNRTIPYILNIFQTICRCLSYNNQEKVKQLCDFFNCKYDIYMPLMLMEALGVYYPGINIKTDNLFQLVDMVFKKANWENQIALQSENPLFLLLEWLSSEKCFKDYFLLINLYSLVAEPIRLDIVKRYFHDIRLGNTKFDSGLVAQFRDNPFDEFIRFRYCIETPSAAIPLTVSLLCDSVLTLYKSNGSTFQTFNGILDFAITHSNYTHPSIELQLDKFIPTCPKGVVSNPSFCGFIDYEIIHRLDREKLNDAEIMSFIRTILNTYGEKQTYKICRYGNGEKIQDEIYQKCSKVIPIEIEKSQGIKTSERIECGFILNKFYENKWYVSDKYLDILKTFISKPEYKTIYISEKKKSFIDVDIDDVSIECLREYIIRLWSDKEFLVPSYFDEIHSISLGNNFYYQQLLKWFTCKLRMRIFPQTKAIVGVKYDVFGFWKEIKKDLSFKSTDSNITEKTKIDDAKKEFIKKESAEVTRRTIESLKRELTPYNYNGAFFELPFSRDILGILIRKYYYQYTLDYDAKENDYSFLKDSAATNYFCAPQLNVTNNPAIDLPFFWCRGKECFKNELINQTLSGNRNWKDYTIYHLIEIIGYPKLKETSAGYEADVVVSKFIAITNKVMRKYKQLKCRSCGHLMFADDNNSFNRYTYFSCINPLCPENRKSIYLNYCYKCKKGLIDSRDSKKCPNNWYICPECFSCCDNAIFEKQARKYTLANKPIPERVKWLMGQGHNDKGIFFCPNCGNQFKINESKRFYCQNCNNTNS